MLTTRKGKSSAFVDGRCYHLLGVSLQIWGATGAPLAHDVLRSGDGTPRLGPPSRKHPPYSTRIAMGQTQLELRGRRRESSSTITGADPASGEVCRSPHRAGDADETRNPCSLQRWSPSRCGGVGLPHFRLSCAISHRMAKARELSWARRKCPLGETLGGESFTPNCANIDDEANSQKPQTLFSELQMDKLG